MGRTNDSKIRILMVLGNTGRGGAQTYAMNVLRNIDRDRFHIDFAVNYVYENGYTDEIQDSGSKIFTIPKFKGVNYFEYVKSFDKLLKEGHYDIVHGHVSSSASIYLKIAKRNGCTTVVHSHSAGYRGNAAEQLIKKFATRGARSQADYWFGCSRIAAERLFGPGFESSPKYHSIPNAIITDRYLFDVDIRKQIRESLEIEDNVILYGHVGSFSAPKNHLFLLEVFRKIVDTKGDKVHLVLLGEGSLKNGIEAKVSQLGIRDQVTFSGNVGNVNEYLMGMDVMIFPSIFEGFPVTLLEAQATGLFCLVSDSITNEVNISECIQPMSLNEGSEAWAIKAMEIPEIDRVSVNRTISLSLYNMDNSIKTLMNLYEEMCIKKRETNN